MQCLLTVTLMQSLYDGSDKSCDVGVKKDNKPLNRFKNITACQFDKIQIKHLQSHMNVFRSQMMTI